MSGIPAGHPQESSRRRDRAIVAATLALCLLGLVAAAGIANREQPAPRSLPAPTMAPGVAETSPPAAAATSYKFLRRTDGLPWRWNPCEAIHYVVNVTNAPAGALADVQLAVERVRQATGIPFVYDGTTDEELGDGSRLPYMPDRYGRRWAPVLITWVVPDETALEFVTEGDRPAVGLASPLQAPNVGQWVSGWVAINAEYPAPAGFTWSGSRGVLLQHELGHLVGLGHVRVAGEIMHPADGGAVDWGPGDLAGLQQLGREQSCLATPELPRGTWWRWLYQPRPN